MTHSRFAEKALAIPLLLIAAALALSGCVAPPSAVTPQTYATQPYMQSVEPQQTYPNQGYPTQPYQAQTYQTPTYQPGYFATICMAGNYTCPVPGYTQPGTNCACPGIGAPSYGVAR